MTAKTTITAEFTAADKVRFSKKVILPCKELEMTACWSWNGAKHGQGRGYGKFWLGGKMMSAHKAAYLLFNGAIAKDQVVGHQCNNEHCVNPAHLKAESQSSNMKYCVMSGRHNSCHHEED